MFIYDEKNNNLIFLIVFDVYTPIETVWELGLPFLRKEKIIFDMDKESLSIFNVDNINVKTNSLALIINVILISFILGLIVSFLFKLPMKKQRKKRANELEEEINI